MGKKIALIVVLVALAGVVAGWIILTSWNRHQEIPQPRVEDGTERTPVDEPGPEPEPELVDLRPILQQLPDDELLLTYPNDAFLVLNARIEMDDVLGTQAELREARMMVDSVYAHLQRLKADRLYRTGFTLAKNLSLDPFLNHLSVVSAGRAPWVVHVLGTRSSNARHQDQELAERVADELASLSALTHELLGAALDLQDLSSLKEIEPWVLSVLVFRDHPDYVQYLNDSGLPGEESTSAIYRRRGRKTVTFGPLDTPDTLVDLRYIAAFQLLQAHRKLKLLADTDRDVHWGSPELRTSHLITCDGLGWLLACKPDGRQLLRRICEARENKLEALPLKELLEIRSTGELRQLCSRSSGYGTKLAKDRGQFFDAQSWAFAHFLWQAEGGKYRERYLECLDLELHGVLDPERFKKTIWEDGAPDISALNTEWQAHIDRLLAE